jgi:hypothetical protein
VLLICVLLTTNLRTLEMTNKKTSKWTSVPYHGAAEVHAGVRKVIDSHKPGDQTVMSASIMVGILSSMGITEVMANRLYSQIRKGGPLHEEWKQAFASGRFYQRCGKSRLSNGSPGDEDDCFGGVGLILTSDLPGSPKRKRDSEKNITKPSAESSHMQTGRPPRRVAQAAREVSPPEIAEVPRGFNDDFDAMGIATVVRCISVCRFVLC